MVSTALTRAVPARIESIDCSIESSQRHLRPEVAAPVVVQSPFDPQPNFDAAPSSAAAHGDGARLLSEIKGCLDQTFLDQRCAASLCPVPQPRLARAAAAPSERAPRPLAPPTTITNDTLEADGICPPTTSATGAQPGPKSRRHLDLLIDVKRYRRRCGRSGRTCARAEVDDGLRNSLELGRTGLTVALPG